MREGGSSVRGYALAAFLGAFLGGIFVARVTNARDKLVATAMQAVSARMREAGCNPQEM